MNEHLSQPNYESQPVPHREPGDTYPAPDREMPNWRRLEVASRYFRDRITDGISQAAEAQTVLDSDTARCIAYTLGRSLGSDSALGEYSQTAQGNYEALRDEYLAFYNNPEAPDWAVEQINWLGGHLIHETFPQTKPSGYGDQCPPNLRRILVPTQMQIAEQSLAAHVPGSFDSAAISKVESSLMRLGADEKPRLQAFLSLPDTDATSGCLVECFEESFAGEFEDIKDLIHATIDLDEHEREVTQFAADRFLYFDYINPDYEALGTEVRRLVDVVERGGRFYAFYK